MSLQPKVTTLHQRDDRQAHISWFSTARGRPWFTTRRACPAWSTSPPRTPPRSPTRYIPTPPTSYKNFLFTAPTFSGRPSPPFFRRHRRHLPPVDPARLKVRPLRPGPPGISTVMLSGVRSTPGEVTDGRWFGRMVGKPWTWLAKNHERPRREERLLRQCHRDRLIGPKCQSKRERFKKVWRLPQSELVFIATSWNVNRHCVKRFFPVMEDFVNMDFPVSGSGGPCQCSCRHMMHPWR